MEHVFYQSHDVNDATSYQELLEFANDLDSKYELQGNRLFYLAMAPHSFGTVTDFLKSSGLTETDGFKKTYH